jgi:hypothetical protein
MEEVTADISDVDIIFAPGSQIVVREWPLHDTELIISNTPSFALSLFII